MYLGPTLEPLEQIRRSATRRFPVVSLVFPVPFQFAPFHFLRFKCNINLSFHSIDATPYTIWLDSARELFSMRTLTRPRIEHIQDLFWCHPGNCRLARPLNPLATSYPLGSWFSAKPAAIPLEFFTRLTFVLYYLLPLKPHSSTVPNHHEGLVTLERHSFSRRPLRATVSCGGFTVLLFK